MDKPTGKRAASAGRERSNRKKPARKPTGDETVTVRDVAGPAQIRFRHFGLVVSFFLFVLIPSVISVLYMEWIAADQYASTVGFSVRREEAAAPVDILGGLAGISSGSSSDTDVLYEFIQSQNLVRRIDDLVDLRAIYSKPNWDPMFAFDPRGTIEDLVEYWARMVNIYYDGGTGLIEIRVNAFEPRDAQKIAEAIFSESTIMINRMSAIAREDATRYARADLDAAVDKLKQARQALTAFRSRTQIVDPQADIQGQMGLLNMLQQQQAQALIELDLLRETVQPGDPRLENAARKISVIEARIAEERRKFGVGGGKDGEEAYATLISEYEGLVVEREFAEKTYLTALANFESATAEAQRQSRYLAAYVEPTLAERSEYPRRATVSGLVGMFLLLAWSISALVYYSVRDRR